MQTGFLVTTPIEGAHPRFTNYELMEGDLLVYDEDGTIWKECPGLAVGGFLLTAEQHATLKPVTFECYGLNYVIHETEPAA